MNFMKSATVAVILALGMVFSASLLSRFFVRIRQDQSITVKGYAERDIVADIGKFTCVCTARGISLQAAYDQLRAGREATLAHLKAAGFAESEIAPGTIETAKIAKRDAQGKESNEIEYYDASQTFTVSSADTARIKSAATSITDLIKDGVDIRAEAPAFYVSDLKDTKLALLASATEDGYRRALALAQGSKGRVGALVAAQQGVFQITERNSTATSSYGEYDTTSIEKTAKAVVTLEYAIDPPKGAR